MKVNNKKKKKSTILTNCNICAQYFIYERTEEVDSFPTSKFFHSKYKIAKKMFENIRCCYGDVEMPVRLTAAADPGRGQGPSGENRGQSKLLAGCHIRASLPPAAAASWNCCGAPAGGPRGTGRAVRPPGKTADTSPLTSAVTSLMEASGKKHTRLTCEK